MKEKLKKNWAVVVLVLLVISGGWNVWVYVTAQMIKLQQESMQSGIMACLTQVAQDVEKTGQVIISKQGKDGKAETLVLVPKGTK